MRLFQQILDANLSPPVARRFADGMRSIAQLSGPLTSQEQTFVQNLVPNAGHTAAPFQDLWTVAEIFLKSCICIALVEGHYSIVKSRQVSIYAHRLGFSAKRLSTLETHVFLHLKNIGERTPDNLKSQVDKRPHRQRLPPDLSRSTTNAMALLNNSDAELITSTTKRVEVTELTQDNTDFWKLV